MTSVQYSLTTCPSVTVVPFTSMIQNSAVSGGRADTSHRRATLRAPSATDVTGHLISGRSATIVFFSIFLNCIEPRSDYDNLYSPLNGSNNICKNTQRQHKAGLK